MWHETGCACGGSCPRCRADLRRLPIQPKLEIGAPDDEFEQEADRVADRVMRMPEPAGPAPRQEAGPALRSQPGCACGGSCSACRADRAAEPRLRLQPQEEEEELLQASPVGGQTAPRLQCQIEGEEEELVRTSSVSGQNPPPIRRHDDLAARIGALRKGGDPLSQSARSFMEPRFGRDFGDVRVHTGRAAGQLAAEIGARAFTVGRDVGFAPGRFDPGSTEGRRLLAHELTHVVQQGRAAEGAEQRLQRQETDPGPPPVTPEVRPQGDAPPPPPNAITVDILDPLSSSLRIGGFSLPSPRGILNGLDALRQFGRPQPPIMPPFPPSQPIELSDEQLRDIACRTLPTLCRPPAPILPPPPLLPPFPSLRLPQPLQLPRLIFYRRRIIDHFIYDRDTLPDRHRLVLDQDATELIDHPNVITDIYGHTDSHGPASYNRRLSQRRADAIGAYLLGRQVPAPQIWTVSGLGEDQPRYPNDQTDWLAAARNRRVELEMRRMVWQWTLPPDLQLTPPSLGGTGIHDPRTRVLAAERAQFDRLRAFVVKVRGEMGRLIAAGPAGAGLISRDNENVLDLFRLVDRLLADLRAERWVVRFNRPPGGSTAASYSVFEDSLSLRRIATDQDLHEVAADLVHEYLHARQDVTAENLLRAGRRPLEHTREDELRQEIESRRHGTYFTRLLVELGYRVGFHKDLSARVFVGRFERERTGSPAEQEAARREIRQQIEQAYTAQLAANAPTRRYLIEVRSGRRAVLIGVGGAETDLGAIPDTVRTQQQLDGHLAGRLSSNPVFASLFRGPGTTTFDIVGFQAFEGPRKVADFGLRRP